MRLQSFLLNEGRSKGISIDEAADTIIKHCSKALTAYYNKSIIYRGVQEESNFISIDPKKHTRESINTYNYYTLINDNSPKWKKYPKRSKSIICTTSGAEADMYGDIYVVFPYDGSKVGLCPFRDYWYSFPYMGIKAGFSKLVYFNEAIQHLFSHPLIEDSIGVINGFNIGGYKKLKKHFKKFDSFIKQSDNSLNDKLKRSAKVDNTTYIPFDGSPTIDKLLDNGLNILKHYNKYKGIEDMFRDYLDPNKNDFKLQQAGDNLPKRNELWTDGKSVLLYEPVHHKCMSLIAKKRIR